MVCSSAGVTWTVTSVLELISGKGSVESWLAAMPPLFVEVVKSGLLLGRDVQEVLSKSDLNNQLKIYFQGKHNYSLVCSALDRSLSL